MAGCDHTTIVFKNGKWLQEDDLGYYNYEKEEYVNLLPFEYGRDGDIHTVKGENIGMKLTMYQHEWDAVYERAGIDTLRPFKINFHTITERLKWMFHCMERVCYRHEVGVWKNGNGDFVYIYHEPLKHSYVSFYFDGDDTYVVLGGYGHWENVYAHFMHRGYGDEFEKQMTVEAYHWLCDDILERIVDTMCMNWEVHDTVLAELRDKFGRYDTEYMVEY